MNQTQPPFAPSQWQKLVSSHLEAPFTSSKVSLSYYDLAWLLRLNADDDSQKPLFPQYLPLVLAAQASDGSWGHHPRAPYICDTLITSLSVVLALHRWRNLDEAIPQAIHRALFSINRLLSQVEQDTYKSVGFELLLPALVEEALDFGLHLIMPPELDSIIQQRKRKLERLPIEEVLRNPSTILHSLEAFYKIPLDWEKVLQLQDKNGAFLSSPAATVRVYQETANPAALRYLLDLVENNDVPVNTPIDIFEINWMLEIIYQLDLQDHLAESYQRGLDYLRQHWTEKGISWSAQFQLPDLDNTSVAYYLLSLEGQVLSPQVFENFYNSEKIYCFPGELDSSPTHLLHFLQALLRLPDTEALRQKALAKLLHLFEMNGWRDKWHLSPYYTIALSVQPLSKLAPQSLETMLCYILETQGQDWATNEPSRLEETAWVAYALYQALDVEDLAPIHIERIHNALTSAIQYLQTNYHEDLLLDNLWIDKCLYSPYSIVHLLITALLLRASL